MHARCAFDAQPLLAPQNKAPASAPLGIQTGRQARLPEIAVFVHAEAPLAGGPPLCVMRALVAACCVPLPLGAFPGPSCTAPYTCILWRSVERVLSSSALFYCGSQVQTCPVSRLCLGRLHPCGVDYSYQTVMCTAASL